MSNLEARKELAIKAIELIKEFRAESALICDGNNILESISVNDDFDTISAKTVHDDEPIEYELNDISSVFKLEMDGCGPCSAYFYEGFDFTVDDAEYEYKKLDKDEFIKYIGELYYMKYRCEEIYEELKSIEKNASLLD